MTGARLLLVVALATVLALVGLEPSGLRSEPDAIVAQGLEVTAQNGASGVVSDPGAHAATIVAALRSVSETLDQLVVIAALIGLVVIAALCASRPVWWLHTVGTVWSPSRWRSGVAALRGPPGRA